jgi:hypothetical protein
LFSSELESKCHLGRNSDIKSKFVNGFLENLFLKQFEWLLKGHSKVNKNELATHFFSIWNQIRQSSPTSMCACACVLESVGVSVYGRGCVFDCVIRYQQAMEKNASAQNYRNKMISYLVFECGSSPCNRFYTHPPLHPPPLSNSVQNFSSIVIMLLRYYYGIYKFFYKIYNFYNIMLIK